MKKTIERSEVLELIEWLQMLRSSVEFTTMKKVGKQADVADIIHKTIMVLNGKVEVVPDDTNEILEGIKADIKEMANYDNVDTLADVMKIIKKHAGEKEGDLWVPQ